MIEAVTDVVPATVARVIIDHTIWRGEFIRRVREARDHHNRRPSCPSEPREAARQADKELRMLYPARTLDQGLVACVVLGTVRNVVGARIKTY